MDTNPNPNPAEQSWTDREKELLAAAKEETSKQIDEFFEKLLRQGIL